MWTDFNLKALSYGIGTFVLGVCAALFLGQILDPVAFAALCIAVPVAAGYMAAYYATTRRIAHGVVTGAIGAVLLVAPLLFIPGPPLPILGAVLLYMGFALLGAFIGNYRRGRLDA